jgi:acid phosphatase
MSARTLVAAGCTALALTVLTACTSGDESTGTAATSEPPAADQPDQRDEPAQPDQPGPRPGGEVPTPDHVMVVIFENEDAENVLGNPEAPYLTSLAQSGVTFTDAHAETHPSQGNYLALFSGSTHGVDDDECPLSFSGPNLASQLLEAGRTFVGYSEDLPEAGYTGCDSGDYARKHNPWVNFKSLHDSVNQPYSALPTDFAQLPTVSFVVPNLCNSMHDCDVATGDSWARENLSDYATWALQHDSLLVVTFDEDEDTEDNHIPTFLVGQMIAPGLSDQRIDHYNLLRTMEDMYGLAPLGQAADAEPLTGIWAASPP